MDILNHQKNSPTSKLLIIFLVSVLILACNKESKEHANIHSGYGTIEVNIIDKSSRKPTNARIYAWGSNDSIYAARECISYRYQMRWIESIGNTGFHFTTIGNGFIIDLPQGKAKIIIEKGKEYRPIVREVDIKAGKTVQIDIELDRWIDMTKHGWYSGDMHVHRSLEEMDSIMLAEDLNVAIVQTYWNSELEEKGLQTTTDQFMNRADSGGTVHIDSTHIFLMSGHEIEGKPGALLTHITGKDNLPLKGNNKANKNNSATFLSLINQAHKLGDYVSIEKPFYKEGHVWLANGADFTQLINNHHNHEGYHPAVKVKKTSLKPDYPNGELGYTMFICDLYYGYLNCGFNIMPTAGSASGVLANPIGFNRIYAKVDGELSMKKWLKAVKAGNSFVTNGPLLLTTFNEKQAGETITLKPATMVEVESTIYSNIPIDRIEIIKNGRVVATDNEVHLNNDTAKVKFKIPFDESAWIAVRCFEKRDDNNTRLAHTAPFFVNIAGKQFKFDQEMIQWFINRTDLLINENMESKEQTVESKAALKIYLETKVKFEELQKKGYQSF
jgi:hypothetical protein